MDLWMLAMPQMQDQPTRCSLAVDAPCSSLRGKQTSNGAFLSMAVFACSSAIFYLLYWVQFCSPNLKPAACCAEPKVHSLHLYCLNALH